MAGSIWHKPIKATRSQWTVRKDARRDRSWLLYWECEPSPSIRAWKRSTGIYWQYTDTASFRDRSVHKAEGKSVNALIRELNYA